MQKDFSRQSTIRIIIILAFVMLLFLSATPVTANADIGPKDRLTVYVTNPPQEEYYLDLLAKNLSTKHANSNLSDSEIAEMDSNMLDLLYSLKDEG